MREFGAAALAIPQEPTVTPSETFTAPDSPPAPRSAWEAVRRLFASLLTSRKVVTALVGLVVLACARRGIILEPDMVAEVVTIFAVLIGAQGLADTGKEKARVEAQTAFGWKDAAQIGVAVGGAVLPGKAGAVVREVTGQSDLEARVGRLERDVEDWTKFRDGLTRGR